MSYEKLPPYIYDHKTGDMRRYDGHAIRSLGKIEGLNCAVKELARCRDLISSDKDMRSQPWVIVGMSKFLSAIEGNIMKLIDEETKK